jgi:biopolymer transport protein ExbB/TolQ
MTENVIIALIATVPAMIISILTLILQTSTKKAVGEVHIAINSRMDQLLRITTEHATAVGKLEGAADEKARSTT